MSAQASGKAEHEWRKKPVVVTAIKWTGENREELRDFVGAALTYNPYRSEPMIHTLEGIMKAGIGDWIIKGVKGEFYPCKPEIFDATYESAHLATATEQAPKSVASSAHFPRITKHDLEVVVEAMDKLREALRADDRELVEKLEGLAAKWDKENSLRSDDSYRYPQQLRAVLAARNEGGK